MSTSLINNIYVDFMEKYRKRLLQIQEQINTERCENGVLLVDFDEYTHLKDVDESVFYCGLDMLPDYAVEKIKHTESKKLIGLKHVGLCLIVEL